MKLGKKPLEILEILPSRIHGKTQDSSNFIAIQEAIMSQYRLKILETITTEYVDLSSSLNLMLKIDNNEIPAPQSIFRFKPNSKSACQFNNLANELNWLIQS